MMGLFVPKAHALLSDVGASGAGVGDMWSTICSTFPASFCNMGLDTPAYIASLVIDIVFLIIGAVAVLVIMFAGIKLIFSQGNEEAVGEAKKIILYAVSGVVLALLVEGIKMFVVSFVLTAAG